MALTVEQALETNLQVIKFPHFGLMTPAKPVESFGPHLKIFVEKMFQLMYHYRGQGLAAPQLDVPYQIIICNTFGDRKRRDREKVFINPTILRPSESCLESEEGCLSIPGVKVQVSRPSAFVLKAQDADGKEITMDLSSQPNSLGRCVLHEVDHLRGILIWDHLSATDKIKCIQAYQTSQVAA